MKKWVATELRGSRVKCRETSFKGKRFVMILLDSPFMTIIKMEPKTKQKRGRYEVGNKINMRSEW